MGCCLPLRLQDGNVYELKLPLHRIFHSAMPIFIIFAFVSKRVALTWYLDPSTKTKNTSYVIVNFPGSFAPW